MSEKSEATSRAWDEMIAAARDVKELYPKLKFGEKKLDEVRIDMLFDEEEPRFIEFDDKFNGGGKGQALAVNVRVLSGPEAGSMRTLIMPKDAEHTLTRGVLGVARKNGRRLKGVAVRIETTNYNHKQYGETRGYTVSQIQAPADSPP